MMSIIEFNKISSDNNTKYFFQIFYMTKNHLNGKKVNFSGLI